MDYPENTGVSKWKAWLKKLGIAGFLFFFLKGMAWLAVFFFAGKCAMQ
ncbi:MAG: hypothetical protein KDC43_20620 [Saprospiraceae bacterium]|nr:hypothetical protein [Saprospiraceae bacterium]MCB0626249.1 hypothetical protein [Saprospiraceae bacterium]MCB0678068.1 hypothetical protein [Saprospiraceae bacterium]MCB0680613.1 hypothetical protein [Saprospiraceae bacterium]